MPTLLSPGAAVKEVDFSQIIPSISTSVGAMVGRFSQGPINTPILISSEQQLLTVFGPPNDLNANDWFTVAQFLQYSNSCYVIRAANTGVYNAVSSGVSTVTILNLNDYENTVANVPATLTAAGSFIAKNPGTIGNNIGVIVVDATTYAAFISWCNTNLALFPGGVSLAAQFNGAPGTSQYVAGLTTDTTPKNDEVHILVIDYTGGITGVPYTVLEVYQGASKAIDAVDYQGLTIYYPNVLNNSSQYVWFSQFPTATSGANVLPFGSTGFSVSAAGKSFAQISVIAAPNFLESLLSGGVTGTPSTIAQMESGYDTLADKNLYSISLVMCGAYPSITTGALEQYVMENLVYLRKDCVGFMSPHTSGAPIRDSITAGATVAAFKTAVALPDNIASYGFMDTGMKYIYDRYSYKYRWVPLNGDCAGLAARTDSTNASWWSFAGYNRGGISNVIKLAYNPSHTDRDFLYPQGINPVIVDPSNGPMLMGDRTMTVKPSAFDRVNVRRLFILLETSISQAAKYSLFEFNDNFTRAMFVNMIDPFLKSIEGGRGITDYEIQCDGNNNTSQVISSNQFVASIYIKPAYSINFITLSFVAVSLNVSFSTVVGKV